MMTALLVTGWMMYLARRTRGKLGLGASRAHLKAHVAQQENRNWLIFGERNAAFDAPYRDELEAWHAGGQLPIMDLVFSRNQPERRYVQHQLRDPAV